MTFNIVECVGFRETDEHIKHISPVPSFAVIHKFDYVFAENGTVQYKDGKLLSKHVSAYTHTFSFIIYLQNYTRYCMLVLHLCSFYRAEALTRLLNSVIEIT